VLDAVTHQEDGFGGGAPVSERRRQRPHELLLGMGELTDLRTRKKNH
jgi:hypothetical protein